MRTLLISGIFPPDIGGPAKFTEDLAKFLHKQGFQVSILTLGEKKERILRDGVEVIRVPRGKNVYFRMMLTVFTILKELKKTNYVFVNGLYIESAVSLFFLNRKSICKIVGDPIWEYAKITGQNSESIENFQHQYLSLRLRLMRLVYNWSFRKFDHLVSPGIELVRIIKCWDDKLSPIHISNGTRCVDKYLHAPSFDVVSCSRLVPWKNIDLLIKICAKLNLSLSIGGSGPEEKYLKSVSSELGGRIEFSGEIEPHKTSDYLAGGRFFALISSYEGMSFTLIEAMMLGRVVIVSDIKANTDVIEDGVNGIVVDVAQFDESVQKIGQLLNDAEFQSKLSMNAHTTAIQKYCAEKQFNSYLDLLA